MVLKVTNVSKLKLQGGIGRCKPIFAGNKLFKTGCDGIQISVINYTKFLNNATYLLGHGTPLLSMCLTPSDNLMLCSCSEDKVILWDLLPLKYASKESEVVKQGLVIGENIGCVLCCCFSWNLKWLALSQAKDIWIVMLTENIFKSRSEDGFSLHKILKTDSNKIDMCLFSSEHPDILVTVEDCNHFQVWDISSGDVVYRSTNLINNHVTSCSFGGMPNKLLVGTKKGNAYAYNFSEKNRPGSCLSFDVSGNFLECFEKDGEQGCFRSDVEEPLFASEHSQCRKCCTILSMKLYDATEQTNRINDWICPEDPKLVSEKMLDTITSPGSIILICCNLGIAMYDCKSCECICSLSFSEIEMLPTMKEAQMDSIEFIYQGGESINDFECWVKTHSSNSKLYNLKFAFERPGFEDVATCDTETSSNNHKRYFGVDSGLSFLSSTPINQKSPLRHCMDPHNKYIKTFGESKIKSFRNHKVKSSGYGNAPRTEMFIPFTNESKKSKSQMKMNQNHPSYHIRASCKEKNVLNIGPPEKIHKDLLICQTTGSNMKLAFSVNGCQIACNSSSSQICILPINALHMEKSIFISGHNSSITSLNFNLNSKWLLSSSTDSTVKVWNWKNRKCISKMKLGSDNNIASNPVTQAGFFFLDKFILAASNNKIHLFSHSLDENSQLSPCSDEGLTAQKVKSIKFPTQHINCFSAANQFHSYLMIAGCSNRNIMIYDFNSQKVAGTFKSAHLLHPPHFLVQQTGSVCPSVPTLPPHAYNLFLSTAIGDGVKLWDLRTKRCVQKYSRHLNRAYASGIDFSPCSRFVAVCSEDKRVYIYDTRNCENYLGQLKGFSGVPMDVAFSPCMTLLAASSLNGHLLTFTPND